MIKFNGFRRGKRRAAGAVVLMCGVSLAILAGEVGAALPALAQEGHAHAEAAQEPAGSAQIKLAAGGHGSGYGHGGWPDPATLGGDFSLTDHTGRRVRLADFRGKPTVLFFGYTQCDDACPLIGKKIGLALDLMGDRADAIQAAFISVDPRNDGPEELAKFVGDMHPRLIGLTGTRKEIYDVAARFRVRRDHIPQNTLVAETVAGEDQPGHTGDEHGNAGHAGADHTDGGHDALRRDDSDRSSPGAPTVITNPAAAATEVARTEAEDDPVASGRVKVPFGTQGPQELHGMAIAHTTHLYLLSPEGRVVKYIYPSMSVEQLAKRLTILADGGAL